MRTLTALANTQIAIKQGSEPLLILKIDWPAPIGTIYYAEKTFTLGTTLIEGRITDVTNLNIQQKAAKTTAEYNSSSLASASFILDDTLTTSHSLKAINDSQLIEGTPASVFLHYPGFAFTDLIPLVVGKITAPIVWSEGERNLRLDVVSKIEDDFVPYASDGTDILNVFPDSLNKAFPLVFGTPINVPMLRLSGSARGTTKYAVTSEMIPGNIIAIENGTTFPQGVSIDISIGYTIFTGFFNGNDFTIQVSNKPIYTNVAFDARPLTDTDNTDASIAWIQPNGVNLVGKLCWLNTTVPAGSTLGRPQLNYCWKQVGKKCWFIYRWKAANGVDQGPDNLHSDVISEVAVLQRNTWGTSQIVWNYGFNWKYTTSFISWWWNAGTNVRQFNVPDIYVANMIPSTQIIDVQAFKKVDNDKGEHLTSVPTAYYSKTLNSPVTVNFNGVPTTLHVTYIAFNPALSDLDASWKDDALYVTLQSTVGPNTSDIIKYLFQTFTNFNIDTASFDTVKTYLTNYPSHFAILQSENVLKLIEEIAFQARCGIRVEGNTVSIVYLSRKPASLISFTEADIVLKTMFLNQSDITDVYTYIIGVWRDAYMSNDAMRKHTIRTSPPVRLEGIAPDENVLVYKNNLQKFGMRKLTYKFYIYNIQSLVQKSLNFWGHRISNIFRKVTLKTGLDFLPYEIFDAVTMGLADTTLTGTIIGTVEEQSISKDENSIGYKIGLASLAGTLIEDPSYWQNDAGDVMPVSPAATIVPATTTEIITTQDNIANDLNNPDNPDATEDLILAKIKTITDDTDYTVDFYGDGYANPATQTDLAATVVGTGINFAIGDEVLIHTNHLGYWIHGGNSSSDVIVARVAWTNNLALTGTQTIDGVSALADGDTIAAMGQTTPAERGAYTYNSGGAWTFLGQPSAIIVQQGALFSTRRFTLTAGDTYTLTNDDPVVVKKASAIGQVSWQTGGHGIIDGGSALTDNDLVLLWNETTPGENGVYAVQSGRWVPLGQPKYVVVAQGTVFAGWKFVLTSLNTYTIDFDSPIDVRFVSHASVNKTNTTAVDVSVTSNNQLVLLINQTGAGLDLNGLWLTINPGNWIFLGQPKYVITGSVGTVRPNSTWRLSGSGAGATYTRIDLKDNVAAKCVSNTLASPASDGTVVGAGEKILYLGAGSFGPGVYVHDGSGTFVFEKQYNSVTIFGGTGDRGSMWCYDATALNYRRTTASWG